MTSTDYASELPSLPAGNPDVTLSVREAFGIDSNMEVPAFSESTDRVPAIGYHMPFPAVGFVATASGDTEFRWVPEGGQLMGG